MDQNETPEKPDSSLAAAQDASVRRRGRPRKASSAGPARSATVAAPAISLDPLDYLLQVINDPTASDARRDRLALAALPYSRAKLHDRAMTQREKTQKAVAKAIRGDDASNGWSQVLRARG
jgi:hypothetical protein